MFCTTSLVVPLLEMSTAMSCGWIMPRSPCMASVECTKKDGTPRDAKVAASFSAMCPLLPTPMKTMRPLQALRHSTMPS